MNHPKKEALGDQRNLFETQDILCLLFCSYLASCFHLRTNSRPILHITIYCENCYYYYQQNCLLHIYLLILPSTICNKTNHTRFFYDPLPTVAYTRGKYQSVYFSSSNPYIINEHNSFPYNIRCNFQKVDQC